MGCRVRAQGSLGWASVLVGLAVRLVEVGREVAQVVGLVRWWARPWVGLEVALAKFGGVRWRELVVAWAGRRRFGGPSTARGVRRTASAMVVGQGCGR